MFLVRIPQFGSIYLLLMFGPIGVGMTISALQYHGRSGKTLAWELHGAGLIIDGTRYAWNDIESVVKTNEKIWDIDNLFQLRWKDYFSPYIKKYIVYLKNGGEVELWVKDSVLDSFNGLKGWMNKLLIE